MADNKKASQRSPVPKCDPTTHIDYAKPAPSSRLREIITKQQARNPMREAVNLYEDPFDKDYDGRLRPMQYPSKHSK
jgi:hypothetical protein